MISFEADNVKAYKLLLWVEIALRESIRHCMRNAYGDHWKKQIPGDLLKKVKESEKEENRPQFNYIRLGPLYYLTLGELIPILRQKVSGGVVELFGGDWVVKDLENILGLRNALCHARPIPSGGLAAIEALHEQMATALTSRQLSHIVSNPEIGVSPKDTARLLISWMDSLREKISTLQCPIGIVDAYEKATQQYWWGVPELSNFDCAALERVAEFIVEYNALPTGVGSAGIRQRICDENKALQLIEIATMELKRFVHE